MAKEQVIGTFEPELEVHVRIGGEDLERIATGKLSLPLEDGKITGFNDALADALEWTAKQIRKDGSSSA